MKKTYKLIDLDCAHCAAKMEDKIGRIPGVASARVNFLTQKFTLEAPEDSFEQILDQAQAVMSSIEPDCRILR